MVWQFLSHDDRPALTAALAHLGMIQEGPTSRAMLLNGAGLAFLNLDLHALANSSARAFAAELIAALEDEGTLPDKATHQALGALLVYVLSMGETQTETGRLCATLVGRYRLIEDDDLLARLARDYGPPGVVTPWREIRRQVKAPGGEAKSYTPPPPPNPHDPLPAPGPLPPGSRLPFARNPLFTGREEDLRALAAQLLPMTNDELRMTNAGPSELVTRHSSLVTSGIGGVGKTQLAVEFAHRYGRFFHGVHWVSMENPDAVATEIALCGAEMRLRPDYDALPAEAQTRETLAAWAGPEVRLLIFDNCEEPTLLAHWRPSSGGARLLVTSRNTLWPAEYGLAARRVHPLPREESRALLREYLEATADGRQPTAGDLAAVAGQRSAVELDRVAAAVGDLPLALALAGHYLARYKRVTVDDYLVELGRADKLLPVGRGAASPTGHDLSVWRTFAVSFDKLDAGDGVDAAALALLARAACFAPGEPLPEALLLAAMDGGAGEQGSEGAGGQGSKGAGEQHVIEDGLLRLLELGLLEEAGTEAMRLHRLIARFAAGALAEEMGAARAAVEKAVFALAARQNKAGYPQALREWEIHFRHVTDAAFDGEDNRTAGLCNELGYYLQMSGDLPAARPYYERALAIRERVLGPDHPDTAGSLNNLGSLLKALGDLPAARPYYERALAIRERVLGPDHPNTATSLNNLGVLCYHEGHFEDSADYMRRALAACEKSLGPNHPDTISSRNNLAAIEARLRSS